MMAPRLPTAAAPQAARPGAHPHLFRLPRLAPSQLQGEQEEATKLILLTFLSLACIMGVLLAPGLLYCLLHSSHCKLKEKLSGLGSDLGADATAAYQSTFSMSLSPLGLDLLSSAVT